MDEVEGRADIDMGNVRKWLRANKLSLNIGKTEYILIGSRHKTNSIDTERGIKIENQVIKKVRNTKVSKSYLFKSYLVFQDAHLGLMFCVIVL